MCELLGMSSNRMATLNISLSTLANHGGQTGPHKDGWGVAYYEGRDVRLIKEVEAAADSDWVRFLQSHDLRSKLAIAHIRKATQGSRSYSNTHPFMREISGRMHIFAHNGCLPGITKSTKLISNRFQPIGETDSETAFCILLNKMADIWGISGEIPDLDKRFKIVSEFSAQMRKLGLANFLYSDGDTLFAHGDRRKPFDDQPAKAPGLVFLERECSGNEKDLSQSGITLSSQRQSIVIVASVPLNDETWKVLDEGEIIAISDGKLRQT